MVNVRKLGGGCDGGLVRDAIEDAKCKRRVAEDLSMEVCVSNGRRTTAGRNESRKELRALLRTWGLTFTPMVVMIINTEKVTGKLIYKDCGG